MPLLIPVIAAGVGFAGGIFATDGVEKITRLVVVAGVGYYVYAKVIK